jgi:RNA polymerase sigma-70 factor, ECF subfamily
VAPMPQAATFDEFYRSAFTDVVRAVRFSVDDRDLADDAVDEAMVRACERWAEVAVMANPEGWVYRVAMNVVRNRQRRLGVERRRGRTERTGQAAGYETAVADPAIARAVASLPLDLRAVVVLRFHLDWSTEQIAVALDIAPGTVKSRLHRALRRLEHLLEERP